MHVGDLVCRRWSASRSRFFRLRVVCKRARWFAQGSTVCRENKGFAACCVSRHTLRNCSPLCFSLAVGMAWRLLGRSAGRCVGVVAWSGQADSLPGAAQEGAFSVVGRAPNTPDGSPAEQLPIAERGTALRRGAGCSANTLERGAAAVGIRRSARRHPVESTRRSPATWTSPSRDENRSRRRVVTGARRALDSRPSHGGGVESTVATPKSTRAATG